MSPEPSYVQLRTADARLDLLRRTLEARASTRQLIRRRAEAGYAMAASQETALPPTAWGPRIQSRRMTLLRGVPEISESA